MSLIRYLVSLERCRAPRRTRRAALQSAAFRRNTPRMKLRRQKEATSTQSPRRPKIAEISEGTVPKMTGPSAPHIWEKNMLHVGGASPPNPLLSSTRNHHYRSVCAKIQVKKQAVNILRLIDWIANRVRAMNCAAPRLASQSLRTPFVPFSAWGEGEFSGGSSSH